MMDDDKPMTAADVASHPAAIVNYILIIVAIYFSFKRNPQFALGPFLAALLFAPLYLIYVFATSQSSQVQGGYGSNYYYN
jgi:hypothetical protein